MKISKLCLLNSYRILKTVQTKKTKALFCFSCAPHDHFGFYVPLEVNGINKTILTPRNTWKDHEAYDAQAKRLVSMFIQNFQEFVNDVEENIKSAGPISL